MEMTRFAQTGFEAKRSRDCGYCLPATDRLQAAFQDVASEPMPDRLRQLAEALEEALQRGELERRRNKPS
jgi:hypothetical protein